PLRRLGVDFPDHAKIGVGIDRSVLGRKVAHMPERGQHLIAGAEILVDGLGFGGRFDNDDFHANPTGYGKGTGDRSARAARNMGNAPRSVKSGGGARRPGERRSEFIFPATISYLAGKYHYYLPCTPIAVRTPA